MLALPLICISAQAQQQFPQTYSLAEALQRLYQVSDAFSASAANVRGKQALSDASASLRLPEISLDARYLKFQKSLELPLGSLAPVATDYGISSPLQFSESDWRLRPSLNVVLPLYTGGKIPAAQAAAAGALRQADAERRQQAQILNTQLVQAYFGEQLAQKALAVRRDVRDGLTAHLADAQKLERAGLITKAQRLQATVARDTGEREYQKASNDRDSVVDTLAQLLHSDTPIQGTTPLFVISTPLDTLRTFRDAALLQHPQIARLRAVSDQAEQGVRVAQSEWKPQVFLFGQYDLRRRDALLTDSDWVVGIGLKYTFMSNKDRSRQVIASRSQQELAEASLREAENQITIATTRAWNDVETARRQFLLLESAITQAGENLRLQELSFREGQATSLDVIDARLTLGGALIDRAKAAYSYDIALAQLLEISGQSGLYDQYVRRADKVL
ncbi:TolC family protein [Collimonas fungivorans]|uniref:TolC family protein n=1 Tax=Collimonas fungivorans TaxID=158899 RepID=UPI0026ED4DF6|nr:TolC family protein [Collimonas fungivorans]